MRIGEVVTEDTQDKLTKACGRPLRIGERLSANDVANALEAQSKKRARRKPKKAAK